MVSVTPAPGHLRRPPRGRCLALLSAARKHREHRRKKRRPRGAKGGILGGRIRSWADRLWQRLRQQIGRRERLVWWSLWSLHRPRSSPGDCSFIGHSRTLRTTIAISGPGVWGGGTLVTILGLIVPGIDLLLRGRSALQTLASGPSAAPCLGAIFGGIEKGRESSPGIPGRASIRLIGRRPEARPRLRRCAYRAHSEATGLRSACPVASSPWVC